MRMFQALSMTIIALMGSGCATVVSGAGETEEVHFTSSPAGAQVLIADRSVGTTPTSTDLARDQDHEVRFSLDGHAPHEAEITSDFNSWVLGNIVFGGIPGLIVDAATGATRTLSPDTVHAELSSAGYGGDASADGPVHARRPDDPSSSP